ncbi:MAG: hypothetical protein RBS80_13855 [Thermoguttaceae bacterium]|jgi:hypothetical protein|nr:hypothetical protein [Thermoguttaceae bacterium]
MRLFVFVLLGTSLLIAGCDDSTVPLSDPSKATLDKNLIGLWQDHHQNGVTYYHVGRLGNNAPEGLMRVAVVSHQNDGELQQPSQVVVFRSDIGGKSYLNLAGVSEEQLESIQESGWQADMLDSYILAKYQVEDDGLLLWAMDKEAKKKAIQDGKIKGEIKQGDNRTRVRFTDTTENLAEFVAAAGDELFVDKPARLERVR